MQPRKSTKEIEDILSRVTYKNWRLRVMEYSSEVVLIQWLFDAPDNNNPTVNEFEQHCRKWFVSRYSTTSEVIRTAYKAVLAAEMHEIDENFRYNCIQIFDPHTDIVALAIHMMDAEQDIRQ